MISRRSWIPTVSPSIRFHVPVELHRSSFNSQFDGNSKLIMLSGEDLFGECHAAGLNETNQADGCHDISGLFNQDEFRTSILIARFIASIRQ